jgi:Pterin 4 alpha carbinolamine dehydratase.
MTDLIRKTCEVCRIGAPLATQAEIDEFMPQLQGWELVEIDGIKRLQKTFKFNNLQTPCRLPIKSAHFASKKAITRPF